MKRAMEALEALHGMRRWVESRSPETAEMVLGLATGDYSEEQKRAQIEQDDCLWRFADAYWVCSEMVDVLEAAAGSLGAVPATAVAPSPAGMVLLERPIPYGPGELIGLRWCGSTDTVVMVDNGGIEFTVVGGMADWNRMASELNSEPGPSITGAELRHLSGGAPFQPTPLCRLGLPENTESPGEVSLLLAAFWLLCQQRVAAATSTHPDRVTRRRLERAGMEHVPDVSIVRLRRPSGSRESAEGGAVNWAHRWIVGGHWANYWVGPKEGDRRLEPRWIAPYVKGPEDKPLVTDRVYELVR